MHELVSASAAAVQFLKGVGISIMLVADYWQETKLSSHRANRHTGQPTTHQMGQLLLPGASQPKPIEQWKDTLAKGFASGCAPNINGREAATQRHSDQLLREQFGLVRLTARSAGFPWAKPRAILGERNDYVPVRFDEREEETEPGQTGLRRPGETWPIATGRLQLLRLVSAPQT